ncbi:putative ATP-dependent RNA helicase DDX11-like protein 8 isoform X2 [Daphnia carinata]|uniref:putative ATP-dependent RNA helicase DDX11-like protein 8 isoform X2 n=1 Tax=Daphnia carinata TaxID=120202 RepID=UPI00257AAA49|nr:putative ATP-dependent RNA helicase DDX11-like protein 8 isoform X2 [Daphnia carinata]
MDVPEVFRFPFEPYPIQLDFMKNVYQCIEQGKLGIFESPTGTGKSLSLICGTLTWLTDHDQHKKFQLEKQLDILKKAAELEETSNPTTNELGEPRWFTLATKNVRNSHEQQQIMAELNKILQKEERIQKLKQRVQNIFSNALNHSELKFNVFAANAKKHLTSELVTLEDDDVLITDDSDEELPVEEPYEETLDDTKIIFASRTHSQISQFVQEVKKSPFGDSIRLIPLASRQQLCINEEITSLKNSTLMNERCLEMQKNRTSSTSVTDDGRPLKKAKKSSCHFRDQKRIQLLSDVSVTEIADIESLILSGKKQNACPYYAARSAINDAQLIVVPYATLLKKNTRESCGLKLRNSVIIIDEAHNLLDTISSLHTICIWGHQISQVHLQLLQYHHRYNARLSAKNVLPIKQLLFFLSCLMKFLGLHGKHEPNHQVALDDKSEGDEKIYECSKFCVEAGFDHINIHTLVEFCEKTKLHHKLLNFKPVTTEVTQISAFKRFVGKLQPERVQEDNALIGDPDRKGAGSSLMPIIEFMRCLRNADQDGRVLCVKKAHPSGGYLKYILLNPGSLFKDFVNEPRAVIVAGGTMQPINEFRFQLFGAAGSPQSRIATFSCDHIIPPDHVLPLVLTRGPSNKELDFSWANRSNLLDELANFLSNINQVVSGGVVCFLPSYDFENQVFEHWMRNNYVSKLENRKKLFREPKEAKEVEHVLAEYARSIRQFPNSSSKCGKNGAMLLCVVGGKLSEGINFSDDLARCVVVVGLPYANSQAVTLKEKMDYLNNNTANFLPAGEVRSPGQIYYESLCFKAVNQSIGRAIRHSKDYAVLILADHRYSRPNSISSLPGWINRHLKVCANFGPSLASILSCYAQTRRG